MNALAPHVEAQPYATLEGEAFGSQNWPSWTSPFPNIWVGPLLVKKENWDKFHDWDW